MISTLPMTKISQTENTPLRIVIIEDLREIREGLSALINGTNGFSCVASYGMVETALAKITSDKPDVILTDLGLPGMSGIEGIERFRQIFPEIPIIALTIYDNDQQIFSALCSGASGYLLKNTPPARLLEALSEAVTGGSPMSPTIAARVVKLFRKFSPPETANYRLTPQETELLKLLTEGHHKKTAAREMNISFHTVSFHLKNIYQKLQVHSKTEAVAKALRERLV
ncbi:MAG TPA: response regulator transcription factor [Pyrinomonadaceae bacterium]|nr:response regulator transcription factor [Pyrinomonadaceae bacterium]